MLDIHVARMHAIDKMNRDPLLVHFNFRVFVGILANEEAHCNESNSRGSEAGTIIVSMMLLLRDRCDFYISQKARLVICLYDVLNATNKSLKEHSKIGCTTTC